MVLHMTTILLSMSLQIVLKNMVILSVWVKTLKNISHLGFLSKKTLKTTNQYNATSLSNLVNNLSDQLYSNFSDCKNLLDYMVLKDEKIVFSCFECQKYITKEFNYELIERFKNTYQFI